MRRPVLLALPLLALAAGCATGVPFETTCDTPEQPWCAALGFLGTLPSAQQGRVWHDWDDPAGRTTWSNLPARFSPRNGVQLGDLDAEAEEAALALLATVLSEQGMSELNAVRAADDYLLDLVGGRDYGNGLYAIALFGQPSAEGAWMLQFSGHHLSHNITFRADAEPAPTPQHFGAEPKGSFTLGGESYSTILEEGAALFAAIEGLSEEERGRARLDQTFADVLIGPDDGSGQLPSYPEGAARGGVVVGDLDSARQALVLTAIERWSEDYQPALADALRARYTDAAALADTRLAWSGPAAGPDPDTAGSYVRLDGPALWIELVVQDGVIIEDETHYHSFFRDKTDDYGATL